MSWLGIVLVVVGIYFAFKVTGVAFKLLFWALVLFGAYWFLAPHIGLPPVL